MRAYEPSDEGFLRLLRWRHGGVWRRFALSQWNNARYMLWRRRGGPRPWARSRFLPGRVVVFVDDLDRCERPRRRMCYRACI